MDRTTAERIMKKACEDYGVTYRQDTPEDSVYQTANDLLYQPVWDTYNAFRDEKGFGPCKNKQAPAELLSSSWCAVRAAHNQFSITSTLLKGARGQTPTWFLRMEAT